MAKKKLDNLLTDADDPVMNFLDKAEEVGSPEDITIEKRKRAKLMKISDFVQIPELRDIFYRDENIMKYITNEIKNGYDPAEPIVYWKHDDQNIIVDGNTRFECTKAAGRDEILAIEHEFNDLEEAIKYAKHRQVRRNLTQSQLYEIANLKLEKVEGKRDSEVKAEMTGTGARNIQKLQAIEKYADDDTKDKVKSGEISIHEGYDRAKEEGLENGKRKPPKNTSKKAKKEEAEEESDEDLDKLDDSDGNPRGLSTWDHSDHKERPEYGPGYEDPDNPADRLVMARREAYVEGEKAGHDKGYDEGLKAGCKVAEDLFYFVLAEIRKGRTPDEIQNDERVSDFSPSVISKFALPEEDENGGI